MRKGPCIVTSNGRPFVKLLDFGVAKSVRDVELSMTATGALMGTPYFMSPEQFMGERDIDSRSDLWSVAVLAYSCLTGKLPFRGESVVVISMAAHAGEFAAPSTLRAELPEAIDAWFARAFSLDREARFSNARELSEAFILAAGLSGGQLEHSAKPPPPAVDPFAATALPATASAASEQPPAPRPAGRGLIAGLTVAAALGLVGTGSSLMYILGQRDVASGAASAAPMIETASASRPGTVTAPPSLASVEQASTSQAVNPPSPTSATPQLPAVTPLSASVDRPALAQPASPPKKPRWRSRKSPCRRLDETKSCMPCCYTARGDRMEPYPSCDCVFDGEQWDREHGITN